MSQIRSPRIATAVRQRYFALRRAVPTKTMTIELRKPESLNQVIDYFRRTLSVRMRAGFAIIAVVLFFTEIIPVWQPHITAKTYALGSAQSLLSPTTQSLADKITFDKKTEVYTFNSGYNPAAKGTTGQGGPHITAQLHSDPKKGITVTDPASHIEFTITPQFDVGAAKQDKNRILYPLNDGFGWLVYTLQANQVKEDLLLKRAPKDTMEYEYKLGLNDSLEARMTPTGNIGVYGNTMLSGNVSTGSANDALLLKKARQNAKKDKLLFVIPAPVVKENNQTKSSVKSHYELSGDTLKVHAKGLKKAVYPLTIDPSIFVTSAQQFMQGNNETNVDFDTSNDLIQKGKLTGARIPSWVSDLTLNSARWNAGFAVGGGYNYVVGGSSGSTNQSSVYWSQFSTTTNTLATPTNPGTGVNGCNSASWCTNAAYNLPNPRAGLGSVVYNGYLYAIGGTDASCSGQGANNVCNNVYVSKLGANGEPNTWVATSSLGTGRRFAGIAVYNNFIYAVGGQSNATLNGETTVEKAGVRPDGTLNAWATTTAIPSARWGATTLQYNGYLYLIGGSSTTTTQNSVQYIKINTDGTLASSWVTTSTFANARATFGGNFATIYGGYLYLTSGCATLTTTSCTTLTATTNDLQLASINADGSITGFSKLSVNLPTAMTGYGLVAWRNALYAIGGCTAVSAATTCSGTAQTAVRYGAVNSDGDVSQIFPSPASNFYASSGSPSPAPIFDLPALGNSNTTAGRSDSGVVVNNGVIYSIGGCANLGCTTMSTRTWRATINSDGTANAWAVDAQLLPAGRGAVGITVHDNVIYIRGGFDGTNDVGTGYHSVVAANGSLGAWTADGTIMANTAGYPFVFARTVPNNGTQSYVYTIGGCQGAAGVGCSAYIPDVQRCTVTSATGALVGGSCVTTASQLQLATGTGIFGGAVYGNYVYLSGGANSLTGAAVSPSGETCTVDTKACGAQTDLIQYALINTSGNITRTDGTTITGGWHIASSRLSRLRRRTTSFAVNGYLYVIAGHDGSGSGATLNDIQKGKINVSTGDVTGMAAVATIITDRWSLKATQANGYMYLLGGCTAGPPPASCTAMNGTNEYVQVYNNWSGSPASYTSSANRPATDRYGGAATVLNGYIYLAGGCTSTVSDCSNSTTATNTTDVSYAPLNPDGSVGTWSTSGTYALPQALSWGGLDSVGGTLYYTGGQTGAGVSQTSVYYSTPSGAGVPAAWALSSNVLPAARSRLSTSVYNGRIYAVGGSTSTAANADTATVYYSPDLSAGGNIGSAWTLNATSFSLSRSGMATVAYGNNLYVLGGFDGANYLLDTQYAPIDATGSVGAWKYGASVPQAVRQGGAFATNGFIYIFGGRSAAAVCTNNTYVVPVNADGSLGTWSQTSLKFNTSRYGVATAYDSGRAYLVGGGCGATVALTGVDSTVYGTLQIQPQIASYSLAIDADTNVFPSKYLINGLDNGIGAAWYLKYQSSESATDNWGVLTNVGKLALGTPGTYTPYDGSSTNLNTTSGARYFNLFLKIDDQQAFGYPEDISRGPNIYDITLQFSSDPAKRLRNGKTFTGGVQQPLDTPF